MHQKRAIATAEIWGFAHLTTATFPGGRASRVLADLEYGQKGLLRDVHFADALHALFSFFLLFQELALARDVSAITLGRHVLSERFN